MTGTSGGSGERDATQPLRDKEEGLAFVEVEANRGREGPSFCSRERAHQETKLIGFYAVHHYTTGTKRSRLVLFMG